MQAVSLKNGVKKTSIGNGLTIKTNEDEKELIDIAIHNLAVSAKIHKGGNHE